MLYGERNTGHTTSKRAVVRTLTWGDRLANIDVFAKCPFYGWVKGKKLRCEGAGSVEAVTVEYDTPIHMHGKKITLCDNEYVKCPIFKRLEELANEQIQKQKDTNGGRNRS